MLEVQPNQGLTSTTVAAPISGQLKSLLLRAEQGLGVPIDEIVEAAVAWVSTHLGQDELVAARDDFFARTGKAFHDDSFYDTRISYFIEHFLFERTISSGSLAGNLPYQLFLKHAVEPAFDLTPSAKQTFADLGKPRHSLFTITKHRDTGMEVKDLLLPQTLKLAPKVGESFRGFSRSQIFQAYIFRTGGGNFLGSGLVIHPSKAHGAILKSLKAARKAKKIQEQTTLDQLAATHIRYLRHRHVDPKSIYMMPP